MNPARPSELELHVLAILWRRGGSTAREVLEGMTDGKPRAYTTILSVLQVMEKKGLLTHSARGAAHVYSPTVTRRQVLGPILRSLVRNVSGGSAPEAMQALLAEADVTSEELAVIRRMLDEPKRPVRGGKSGKQGGKA